MFFWRKCRVYYFRLNPLQVQLRTCFTEGKRTSHSASHIIKNTFIPEADFIWGDKGSYLFCGEAGSVTVEAALVVPLLLSAFMAIIMWQQVFLVQAEIESALLETARQRARQEYMLETTSQTIKQEGLNLLQTELLFRKNRRQGGTPYGVSVMGLSLLGSKYRKETEEIYLEAEYTIKIPAFFLGTWKLPLKASITQKAWNGYCPGRGEEGNAEHFVYVTEHGTAYHRRSDCYHLRVSVKRTENVLPYYEGEMKLRACEFCVKAGRRKDALYISDEGECYHEDSSCGGITRTVYRKPVSETGGKKPCGDCCSL